MDKIDQYSFDVKWSPQDNCYFAHCREFPGLSAHGESRVEAVEEAEIALELFVEEYKEEGNKLPEPNIIDY